MEPKQDKLFATLMGATRAWMVGIFLFGVVLSLVLPAIPTAPYPWQALRGLVSGIATTAIATVVVLAVSEIKPFREYLERRLLRALEAVQPGTINEMERRLAGHIKKDFIDRATDVAWLRTTFSEPELRSLRSDAVKATLPDLDEQRLALLNQHVYPLIERPWRADLRINLVYSEVPGRPGLLSVDADFVCRYENPASRQLEFEQPIKAVIDKVEGIVPADVTTPFWFKADGRPLDVRWQIKDDVPPGKITLEAKLSWAVPPGGVQVHEHREYKKPASDNYYHFRSAFLTKDITISFTHPAYIKPAAYGSFLGAEPERIESPTHHQWIFRGWFLELHGIVIVWPL